ncbi:peptidase S8/S53 domain-containing protein [Mycena haematopus]|nr:peptidase S8/S53 domain-containing protein [Mycena haematopus]
MHTTHLLLPFLLATSAAAAVVHEKRAGHPSLIYSRRLEGHVTVPLKVGLKQQNTEYLAEHLLSVSDPQSPYFGQHWPPAKVAQVFAPANESRDAVTAWLANAGFSLERLRISDNKAWIHVENATVGEVEDLLNTEYHVYAHESGEEHAACDSYSLPEHIADHIELITPTVQPNIKLGLSARPSERSTMSRKRSAPLLPVGCDQAFIPACIRSLYNMTYVPKATDRNSFGIVSQAPATYLQSDLDTFFANFSPSLVGKSPLFVSIDGGIVDAVNGTDVGEDGWILQYTMTLVEPQPVTMLQVGTLITGNFLSFNEWLDAVDGSYCTSGGGDDFTFDPQFPNLPIGDFQAHSCGTVKPPYVISNSRADYEYRLSPFYTQRQCIEFGKLGLMGVTVLFSAGNVGAAGTTRGYCLDDNGSCSVNLNATHFNPGWPAACPWITAVGGTQVKANISGASANGVAQEEVWNSGGGGFSNRFAMPQYQEASVNAFLKQLRQTNPSQLKHFNPGGRAYPDISANANNFVAVEEGALTLDSGTSGAAPTVASIITLVNDARLAAGKSPVGFINPAIYSPHFAGAFNDIVDGTSQGCKGCGGFQAVPGWDAASGVGTPNLGVLVEKWLALP